MAVGLFGAIATKGCFIQRTFRPPVQRLPLLYGHSINLRRKETNIILSRMAIIDQDTDENDNDSKDTGRYTPIKHSEEFLLHLESVKSSWPYKDEDGTDQTSDSGSDYSVSCTGEPSMDPSRMLQSLTDDDYDWV
mmetsp:Transcript_1675/g.2322  ORF Transcript_1675/g.2322 Transcript_1675/m.2322 type:complete len:135 (+) Transcript_1675:172-576(+)